MKNRLRQLTREEYEATLIDPLRDVTATADEVVNLWGYADEALRVVFPHVCNCEHNVAYIYESGNHKFQQVLISSHESNVYLAVVVDKQAKVIVGHHRLDLNVLCGLAS